MFARSTQTILAIVLFFVVFATATPVPQTNSCNTGPVQCCNSLQSTKDNAPLNLLLGLLGVVLGPVEALVGLTCSPISVIGVGSSGCNTSPVCCTNNNVGGLISVGCIPIIL
ncbi:hypothetical protein NLI96_g10989 [Meripilus lineatus]|uniref:Hydrophobin n=1 Tax=Meripilus lineatus TaxID=2056292 RepID=A0AAD5UXJ3_9APHY|nr:hypothetical protein NLI96_g10989 [Physisporinus lineatus]